MSNKVWLIGGTRDSATIANILAESQVSLVITVTTDSAQTLYSCGAEVFVGCLDKSAMGSFCQQNSVKAVIDASHPYATQVSRQAIAVTTQLKIPYLRYERANYPDWDVRKQDTEVIKLASFDSLLTGDYLINQRVLLTVGCNALPKFQSWQKRATLFARILPKIKSLEMAIAAGFNSDRLIAIRPPLSVDTETALWRQWQISLVVTKASGKAGGEDVKRQVAANLGIPLIIITRPQINYPQQTSEFAEVLAFCRAIHVSR